MHPLRRFAPPILVDWARAMFRRKANWKFAPHGWAEREKSDSAAGWNAEDVLATYKRKWPLFQQLISGPGPLGIAHESACDRRDDVFSHNVVMSFGYVLGLAARGRPAISFLDWGGGIGHYYLLAKALLPEVAIDYHCKDVPLLA